jgi:hypothetical protein
VIRRRMAATSPLRLEKRLLTSMTESPANFGSWFMTKLAIFPQPWPIQGIIEADL